MKANEAAVLSLRIKKYSELSDIEKVSVVPNPYSQNAAILGDHSRSQRVASVVSVSC